MGVAVSIILTHPPHFTREDKGGGEILEIFLSKFYLLNEKEKSKHIHSKPPMKFTKVSSKSRGFENFFENWLYLNKIQPKGSLRDNPYIGDWNVFFIYHPFLFVLKGHPLYRGLKHFITATIRLPTRVLKGQPLYRGLKPEFFKKPSLVRLSPRKKFLKQFTLSSKA